MTLRLVSSHDTIAARDRREEAAQAARDILRSVVLHGDDDILFASDTLVDYGNSDVADDALILAARIHVRDRNRARRPAPVWRLDEVALFCAAGFAIVMIAVAGWA